jgi:hypothetical protein
MKRYPSTIGYKLVDGTPKNKSDSPVQDDAATASRTARAYGWFGRILPLSFFDSLGKDLEIVENRCIFTLQVTVWMMLMQRLSAPGTLDWALTELLGGNGRELLPQCKRIREDNISANTGGREPAWSVALAGHAGGRDAPRGDGPGNAPAVRPHVWQQGSQ